MAADFYRVKAAGLAWNLAQLQLGKALQEARDAFRAELVACGLDPDAEYRLNDQEQTIEKVDAVESGGHG